ncbi:putative carboxylesterase 15 [Panicum miliaceum]|uniref:Carboxylesterase 15 n=1 Tax=Panicum miliaceum TaxID=4540 RepID=A0A3L6R575_PANMI|nr:putative carboxylesterase 15 [Panicum miliaceum]
MSGGEAQRVVEDFFGVIRLFDDGSVVRGDESTIMPAGPFPDAPGVQWKDAVYDAARGPKRFAAELPAVVLSVQYRLAPEHRLPAAIEDGATFFSWLRAQAAAPGAGAEPWLAESADFSRTFVSGVSAGANLAHHAVVRIAAGQILLGPVRIAGYILFSAFFGSNERTATESDPPVGASLTVEMSDQLWRMALPAGATRDNPLANPFAPGGVSLEPLPLPPALVVAPGRDVLCGHVLRYAARLKEMGKAVELAEFVGERHGFSVGQRSEATEELMEILKRFVHKLLNDVN